MESVQHVAYNFSLKKIQKTETKASGADCKRTDVFLVTNG